MCCIVSVRLPEYESVGAGLYTTIIKLMQHRKVPLIRNKFESFLMHKQHLRRKSHRFAKVSSRGEPIARLLEKSNEIEMPTMSSLPPEWVDHFEECTVLLTEVTAISRPVLKSER